MHDRLISALHYDRESGVFTWLIRSGRAALGTRAGTIKNGYRYIRFEGVAYRANRLAWFYVNREWPQAEIDHVDTDPLNDAWLNLRPANSLQNKANSKARKDSALGVKGVQRCQSGRFKAYIKVSGRSVSLGTFDTLLDARDAYRAAAKKLHGEFARF